MNLNGNRSVPSKFMLDIEYSVITTDVIKSFDCSILSGALLFVGVEALGSSQQHQLFPVFLGRTSTKQRINCLAQGHSTVPLVSLELMTLRTPSLTLYQLSHHGPQCLASYFC